MAQDIGSIGSANGVQPLTQRSGPGYPRSAPTPSAAQDKAPQGHSASAPASVLHDDAIRAQLAATGSNLRFETDKETGQSVISVVDQATGAVIRQIPSEEELRLAKVLDKLARGQVEDTA